MELRRNPARRAGLAGLAALLVFGAAACSGGNRLVGTAPAATVNGTEISQSDVVAATQATKRFYEDSIEAGQDDGSLAALVDQMKGATTDSVGTEGASQVLSDMIADQVIHDALEKADALPTKADEDSLRSDLETQVGAAELKKIDKEYIRRYVERKALNDAYTKWAAEQAQKAQKPYTPEEREQQKQAFFQQYFADNPLCLNAIQTSTEDEATQARARIDAGEDFVTVAKSFVPEGSAIPDEGSIACLTFDQAAQVIGSDVTDAKVGDLFGPVTYSQGEGAQPAYLVLRVEQTDGYTYDEAEPLIDSQVPDGPTEIDPSTFDASDSLDKLLKRAEIDVNPLFGRWSAADQAVIPPRVPGATSTTTTTIPVGAVSGS